MLPNQVPAPPVGMTMSPLYDVILAANLVVVAIVLAWAVRESLRMRRSLPIWLMIGTTIACLLECIFDVVCLVWWADVGRDPLYRIFNISVPGWMLAAYTWFIGGQGYYAYRKFQTGMTWSNLWALYFFGWLANMALEIPALMIGNIYTYYGEQPFQILGFPLWMAVTNSLMPIVLGALVHWLDDMLRGPRTLFVLALGPAAVGGAQIAAGWPIWLALNSGRGPLVTHAAALVTLGLALSLVYLIGAKLCVVTPVGERIAREFSARRADPAPRPH